MHTHIEKLVIQNFRNFENQYVNFDSYINCIFGNNGNGKTNILEAIYLLINRRSFRKNSNFAQFLNYDLDETNFNLQILFQQDSERQTLAVKHDGPSIVTYSRNGKIDKSKSDLVTIFINPFDAYEFFNTPKKRREWIDDHLSYIDPIYKRELRTYTQALRQKNILLQKKSYDYEGQIRVLNLQLAQSIILISNKREVFLDELKQYYFNTFKQIFDIECELGVELESSVPKMSLEKTENYLNQALEKESIIGKSQYGIHKDNYLIFFNGLNAIDYCSVGQQKMTYFSLIFAYIKHFRYKCNTFPIVLMDDISGELDENRWNKLISYLESLNLQVIITTANKKFKEKLVKLNSVKLLNVTEGNIEDI